MSSSSAAARGAFHSDWPATALLIGGFSGLNLVPLLIPVLQREKGYELSAAATIGSLEIAACACASILLSRFGSPAGARRRLIAGGMLALAANGATLLFANYGIVAVARVMAGVAAGVALHLSGIAIARSAHPIKAYGMVFGRCAIFYSLLLIGLPAALTTFGGKLVFLVSTGLLVFALAGVRVAAPGTRHAALSAKCESRDAAVRFSLFAVAAVLFVPLGGMWSFAEPIARALELPQGTVGIALSLAAAAGALGGALAHAIGSVRSFIRPASAAIATAAGIFMLLPFAKFAPAFIALMTLCGVLFVFGSSVLGATAAAVDPGGATSAALNGWAILSFALGPALFGLAFPRVGLGGTAVLAVSLLVVSVPLLMPLRRVHPT